MPAVNLNCSSGYQGSFYVGTFIEYERSVHSYQNATLNLLRPNWPQVNHKTLNKDKNLWVR